MNKIKRIEKSVKALERSTLKLKKARAERIWIQENPHINILNYPFYKFLRIIKRK